MQGLTPRVIEVRELLVSLGILSNIMQWRFSLENIDSDNSKVLLNDSFAEIDGSSGINP